MGDDFTAVCGRTAWTMCFSRGDWHTRTETYTALECTEEEFRVHATLDAYESGERIFSRQWTESLPRDHV